MEGQAEMEFLAVTSRAIVAVEVKSGSRTKAKSLTSYINKYSPELAIKLAKVKPSYNQKTKIYTLSLYLAWDVIDIVERI